MAAVVPWFSRGRANAEDPVLAGVFPLRWAEMRDRWLVGWPLG